VWRFYARTIIQYFLIQLFRFVCFIALINFCFFVVVCLLLFFFFFVCFLFFPPFILIFTVVCSAATETKATSIAMTLFGPDTDLK